MNQEQKTDEQHKKRTPIGRRSLIWILLWAVAIFYLFMMSGERDHVDLPYSEFKTQLTKGQIAEVTIKGQKIFGKFNEEFFVQSSESEDSTAYRFFSTVRPSFEDPGLIEMLESEQVTIKAETEDDSWFWNMLIILFPWILILIYFAYIRRKMQGQMGKMMPGGLFSIGKSRAKRFRRSSSDVTFDDVAGLDNAKKDLREIIEYLKEPEKYASLGANVPKGVLFMGPPGTGKTLLARATAGEAEVTFYSIGGSEFIQMFVGVGASRVRDMFANAKKEAPAIIFIDEIDSIGRARGTGLGGGHDEREQTLNQILSEMDGFSRTESVIVMAATNRPDVLDPALTRPGRFDRQITLELPQKQARRKILEIHTRQVPLADEVKLDQLAATTVGFSGADLKNLVNEAALLAGRRGHKTVQASDFDQARDKIVLGHEREEMFSDWEKKVIAYHEAGHAMMAKLLPGTDPLKKVSIIPRGRSLGATEQMPEEDRHNFSRKYLLNRIGIMLGGRVAEKIVFDDVTTGAADDLKKVTQLARRMVCQWGMSETVGAMSFRYGERHAFLGRELASEKDFSEHMAQVIDEEVQAIIQKLEKKALDTLGQNREGLDNIANALLEHETLTAGQIDRLLETNSKETEQQTEEESVS